MPVNIVRLNPTQFAPGGGRRGRYVNPQPDRLMNELSILNSRQGFQSGEGDKDRKLQMVLALMGQKSSQRRFDASESRADADMQLLRDQLLTQKTNRAGDILHRDRREGVEDKRFDARKEWEKEMSDREFTSREDQLKFNRDLATSQAAGQKRLEDLALLNERFRTLADETTNLGKLSDMGLASAEAVAGVNSSELFANVERHVADSYLSRGSSIELWLKKYAANPDQNKSAIDEAFKFSEGLIRTSISAISNKDTSTAERMAGVYLFTGKGKGDKSFIMELVGMFEEAALKADDYGHKDIAKRLRDKAFQMHKDMIPFLPKAHEAVTAFVDAAGMKTQMNAMAEKNRQAQIGFGQSLVDRRRFQQDVFDNEGFQGPMVAPDDPTVPEFTRTDPQLEGVMDLLNAFAPAGSSPASNENTATGLRDRRSEILGGINKRGRIRETEGRNARELLVEQRKNFLIEEAILSGASDSELYDLIQRLEKPWTKSFSPSSIVGRRG